LGNSQQIREKREHPFPSNSICGTVVDANVEEIDAKGGERSQGNVSHGLLTNFWPLMRECAKQDEKSEQTHSRFGGTAEEGALQEKETERTTDGLNP